MFFAGHLFFIITGNVDSEDAGKKYDGEETGDTGTGRFF